jgi:hypothetical protein
MVLLEEALLVLELVLELGLVLVVQLALVLPELEQEQALALVAVGALEPVQEAGPVGVWLALLVVPVSKMVCLDQIVVLAVLALHREGLASAVDMERGLGQER